VVSAEKLLALIDGIGGIVWEADPDSVQFSFVSAQAERILGFAASEWLAQPDFWRRHTHPDDVERCTASFREATREGRDQPFESRMIAADGRTVWLRGIASVRASADRSPRLVGILLDITPQKTRDTEGQRLSRLYEALIESASDSVALLAADGTVMFQSAAVVRQLGIRPDELVGRSSFEIVHPEDRPLVEDMLRETLATDAVGGPVRFRGRHASGAWRTLELVAKRFLDHEGTPHAVTSTRDLTDVVQAQRELESARERLAHASKMEAIGRLAGGVAHDFNNLLTVIAGYTDLVMGTMQKTDPRMADLEEIRRATQRASLLTRQLLAFSRKQVLRPEEIDLNLVVREIAALIRRLIGEDVELEVATEPGPLPVMADRSQLEQVLMNLAVNARDAMPAGGQLRIRTRQAKGEVVLEVEDTGAGMSAEVKTRLFEPFFTTKEVGKGTGLGLSTVYGIVRQSGGDIQVCSEEGHGTRFTIALPPAGAGPPHAEEAPPEPAARETVLLVEDDAQVRDLVTQVLRRLGYEVVVASTAAGALELCRRHGDRIRLLLTDIALADGSGAGLYAPVSSAVPGVAVLYMSGYAEDTALVRGAREAGAPFLQKPFTPSALAGKVREVLEGRQGS
jgi:two-component system, cell cycle sensor histidine kinase and response regulator CckA